jgi:hypothetical protein
MEQKETKQETQRNKTKTKDNQNQTKTKTRETLQATGGHIAHCKRNGFGSIGSLCSWNTMLNEKCGQLLNLSEGPLPVEPRLWAGCALQSLFSKLGTELGVELNHFMR